MKTKLLLSSIIILFLITGFNCKSSDERKTDMEKKPVKDIIEEYSGQMMAIDGVIGLYEGQLEDGTTCIKVMVIEESSEIDKKIPKEIEGYPVVIEVTGEIKPM